ncbi:ABC transporter substrate-binding protein [Phaeobacter sp. HF9A]|nr:ABC transporter substrate-binding protein [Phaeobacter sp. HF9A]
MFAPNLVRAAGSTIKIGYIGSLSGIRAAFGETEDWTLARIKQHLANGLSHNGKTYQVELVIRDNQSDVNRSATVAQELVLRERCNLILVQDGAGALAVGELADARRVPTISTMVPWQGWMFPRGGNPVEGFPYTFHFFSGTDTVLANFVQMFDMLDTNKTVGTLYLDNPGGQGLMHPEMGLPGALKAGGYREVTAGKFQEATNDFSSAIAQFRDADTDILSGFMYPNHFIPFWNQVAQAGLSPKAGAIAAAFLFPGPLAALGASANGLSTEVWWTPRFPFGSSITGQSAAQLAADWESETGRQWTQPLGYGHALWEVGLAAIANCADPLDPDSLRDGIASLNTETVIGPVNFAQSPIKSVATTGIVGGQWRALGGAYPLELQVVHNAGMPAVPLDGEMIPMGAA